MPKSEQRARHVGAEQLGGGDDRRDGELVGMHPQLEESDLDRADLDEELRPLCLALRL